MKIQILALLVICSTALARPNRWRPRPVAGSPCQISRPQRCGNTTLVVEELTGPGFGANVCKHYKQYPAFSYVYMHKTYCYNITTRFGATRQFCYPYLECTSTGRCDSLVNSSSVITCCDGYTVNTTNDDYGYHHRRRLDCPIKLEETVVDCINKLGLTAASDLIAQEGLQGALNNQAERFTLFVPSNEALADLNADEEDDLNALLLSHAIVGSRRTSSLYGGRNIPSLADGCFIQTTRVLENKRERSRSRSTSHSRSTSNSRWARSASHSKSSKDYYTNLRLFVNGAEVVQGDACIARNGIVHVINDVIRSSNESLLSVLNSNPDLTKFAALVQKSRQEYLLNSRKALSTVFAPEDSSISDHVQECLCQPKNKRFLYKFVAAHIARGAETNSTITLRDKIFSKFCSYYGYHKCALKVSVDNGEVTIGNSEVTDTDIPASNGVLHIISEPFNNSKLNRNRVCPPPPTTGPTAPTGSGDSTAPTGPTGSGDSTVPTGPTGSGDSTVPTGSSDSTAPTRPPEEA